MHITNLAVAYGWAGTVMREITTGGTSSPLMKLQWTAAVCTLDAKTALKHRKAQ